MSSLVDEYRILLPRIKEAEKYGNRPLMLDLIDSITTKIQTKMQDPLRSEEDQETCKQIVLTLKQHTIVSAWHTEEEEAESEGIDSGEEGTYEEPDGFYEGMPILEGQ